MVQRKIILTPLAIADLEELESYLFSDSAVIAKRYIERIFAKMRILREFPEIGNPVPECLERGFRQIKHQKHRIVYQIMKDESIYVLRVIHSSRLLDVEHEDFGF